MDLRKSEEEKIYELRQKIKELEIKSEKHNHKIDKKYSKIFTEDDYIKNILKVTNDE